MDKKFKLNEDWSSTIMGCFIILAILVLYTCNVSIKWPSFGWANAGELGKVFGWGNLGQTLLVFVVSFLIVCATNMMSGKKFKDNLGYLIVFGITFVAMALSGNKLMKEYGIETVIFSLVLGLCISNFFKLPEWIKGAFSAEMYVKIGLVLLGTTVLFDKLVQLGAVGLIQAVVVVFGVWYFSFWLCKKFKIDEEMNMMLSSGVSICGVSAAVATAGAIKGDKAKLSFVVSLVLVVAVPMIFLMPYLAKWIFSIPALANLIGGNDAELAGAWIGGTVDTTAAVVATGAIYGEAAEKAAVIIKSSQNVLLGVAAFAISLYWTFKHSRGNVGSEVKYADKPNAMVLWERFPKFVLGFLAASLLFSFIIDPGANKAALGAIRSFQGLFFALAFTSIGLETRFKDFITKGNRKATSAFIIAQTFNVFFTLLIVFLLHYLIGYPSI